MKINNMLLSRTPVIIIRYVLSFFLLLNSGVANAEPDEQLSAIINPLKIEADKGDVDALNRLSELYFSIFCCTAGEEYQGDGKYAKEALDYLLAMHKEGNADLEFVIGKFYNFGLGAPTSDATAFEWWLKSAKNGNADAQNNVGYMYQTGREIDQNFDKALAWYKKAADQGDKNALKNIGDMYYEGLGVKTDCGEALKWFEQAEEYNDSRASERIDEMRKDPKCAATLALDTLPSSLATHGSSKASDDSETADDAFEQYQLAASHDDGGNKRIDYVKAKYWYEKSAAQGNLDAMRALGFMYEKGKGMEIDYKKAIEIYTEAANRGDIGSHSNLWWMYSQGIGVEKNEKIAAEWNQKSEKLQQAREAK